MRVPGLARALGPLVAVGAALAMAPSLDALRRAAPFVAVPLDASLRVPFSALFLTPWDERLRPGDRVLQVSIGNGGHPRSPRDRAGLYRLLTRDPAAPTPASVTLQVERGQAARVFEVPVLDEPGWRRLARNWPVLFVGSAFLLFGLAAALGSRHPSATPLFALSSCVALSLLSQVDPLLPLDAGPFGLPSLRARLGLLAVTLAPAAILHLAMRFPVVSRRFRSGSVAAVPYGFWLFMAGFGQLQLGDASFLNSLERIAIGATFVGACVLLVGSLTAARSMKPIERARTRALLVGLGVGSAAPFVLFLSSAAVPSHLRAPVIVSLLAFPAAIAWAIVRYRLLDPPAWLRGALLASLTGVVSLLGATAAVSVAVLWFASEPATIGHAEAVAIAVGAAVLYQVVQLGVRGAAARRLDPRDSDSLLDEAIRALASGRCPDAVLRELQEIVHRHVGPQALDVVALDAPAALGTLRRSGLALWRSAGAPRHGVVCASGRSEDPGPDEAEAVVPLVSATQPARLLVLASRSDGLPYSEAQRQILEGLMHVATTAIDASAAASGLERLVEERTTALTAALADRQHVLRAARSVLEAQDVASVECALAAFVAAEGATASWTDPADPAVRDLLALGVEAPGRASRTIWIRGLTDERAQQLTPQLETLCTFAGLAIARLELLGELKQEVERQANEIAEISSRRLHAEFVRGVAHELRKPTEEVRRRADALWRAGLEPRTDLARIRAAIREMSRRLDLLLFHSGLRLAQQRIDLVRVVDDAVETTRAVQPDRRYRVRHELRRLPLVGDPSRLQSVVENLLDNAVKATDPGARIAVRTRWERLGSPPEGWAVLEVEDPGRGIAPDRLAAIFEPGVSFSAEGFGLGLSLCREIVRRHRGQIRVESAPGRTLFQVRLPQLRADAGETDDEFGIDPSG